MIRTAATVRFIVEPEAGFEPATYALRVRSSER